MEYVILILVFGTIIAIISGIVHSVKKQKTEKLKVIEKLNIIGFKADKILDEGANHFAIDNANKKIFISTKEMPSGKIFKYSDIISYELVENDASIAKGSSGKAFVGAALFGTVGAIVGSAGGRKIDTLCKGMQLIITISDILNPIVRLNLISGFAAEQSGYEKSSLVYQSAFNFAKEVMGTLVAIQKETEGNLPQSQEA